MTSDQTHPTTPISDGDLQIAREAAAQLLDAEDFRQVEAQYTREGKMDGCRDVRAALRAIALSRASNPPPDTAVAGDLWQPISTAPTHGEKIRVRRKDGVVCQLYANPEWKESEALRHYEEWCPMPVPNRLRADADAELGVLQHAARNGTLRIRRSERLPDADADAGMVWPIEIELPCINGLSCWFTIGNLYSPDRAARGYTNGVLSDELAYALSDHIVRSLASDAGRLAPASSGQEDADGWRSMDSAPKDGTYVLIAADGNVAEARWDETDNNWWAANNDSSDYWGGALYPTHWRPLPAAPVEPGR